MRRRRHHRRSRRSHVRGYRSYRGVKTRGRRIRRYGSSRGGIRL
jgi:hypothetical protein